MKIITAPDSFKGSLSAPRLCEAIRGGILQVVPDAEVVALPMADGGEGTMENMVQATQGTIRQMYVRDPLGRLVQAAYGILGDRRTVVVEMAQASGLTLLREDERNPLHASSYGTGELIRHALDAGYRSFIIGLGGSATNDGGAGMLKALGMRLLNARGEPIAEGGAALADVAELDDSDFDARVGEASFTIASDVENTLCGQNGASAVFGPQKGATPQMVELLDAALSNYADRIAARKGIQTRDIPGSGAAGGLGAALLAYMQAEARSGIELVMEAVQLDKHLEGADLVITGEGRLDAQTLSGKVIAGVCKVARRHRVPAIALCGGMELNGGQCEALGLTAGFSVISRPCSLEEAYRHTEPWVRQSAEQIMRMFMLGAMSGAYRDGGSR